MNSKGLMPFGCKEIACNCDSDRCVSRSLSSVVALPQFPNCPTVRGGASIGVYRLSFPTPSQLPRSEFLGVNSLC